MKKVGDMPTRQIGIGIILENDVHNYVRSLELELWQHFGLLQGFSSYREGLIQAKENINSERR